jgi:prephenate dehydratase
MGVVKAQLALTAHRSQLYVTALFPHHVRLQLYCWGPEMVKIREVRSIEVVFAQAEEWLQANVPQAIHNRTYPSTAAAVQSLVETGALDIAAIGGEEAAAVPVVAKNIQTEPNVTIFCKVERNEPDWDSLEHLLVAITDFNDPAFEALMNLAADFGCGICSNWILDHYVSRVGVFEIKNFLSTSRLHELSAAIERRLSKTFLIGGYSGKSITQLAHDKYTST